MVQQVTALVTKPENLRSLSSELLQTLVHVQLSCTTIYV